MDGKDTTSDLKEKSIGESIEAQFDDLFAPRKPDKISETGKKSPAPDTPAAKKVQQKATVQKPLNKKPVPQKAPDSKKKLPSSSTPSDKTPKQNFAPNNTLIQKKAPPVQAVKNKPPVKEDVPIAKEEETPKDTDETAVQNVFKIANEEFKKNIFLEKARQYLNPLIYIILILMLVTLSIFNGMIMDSDAILEFLNLKDTSTSISAPVTINHVNKRKVSVSKKDTRVPSQKEVIKESKNEKPDLQVSNTVKEEDKSRTNADTVLLTKPEPSDKPIEIVKERFVSYPYSVYLGSYGSIEKVNIASSDYKKTGIVSYWIKLDLGKKGVWFRLFTGYFRTREDADKFIKARQLKEAESRLTKYTIFLGIYRSKEDADRQKANMEKLGYSPYIINDSTDVYRLYTGAFYQKDRAEKLKNNLEPKGIRCEIVER